MNCLHYPGRLLTTAGPNTADDFTMRPPRGKSNAELLIHLKTAGRFFYNTRTGCPSQSISASTGMGLATR
jgi:hypothetical protein